MTSEQLQNISEKCGISFLQADLVLETLLSGYLHFFKVELMESHGKRFSLVCTFSLRMQHW